MMKRFFSVKRRLVFLLAAGGMIVPAFGQLKNRISFSAGAGYVLSYGSDQDYVANENDFPRTPAHVAPSFGLSAAHFFNRIGIELDVRYLMSSRLTLQDPSDGDEVELDSLKRLMLTAALVYEISDGELRPYLSLGAGMDAAIGAEDQTLTTKSGFEAAFAAPKQTLEFVGRAGAGILYFFGSKLGLKLDAGLLFNLKTDDHPFISTLDFRLGLVFGF